ncbi:hypothetical protein [Streptomyces nitrosporeus]|uniref:Uncharacterized protein n=1 Tax=Streptomyces nitrosporeus TaxID=28894 RepID=A0A5J6F9E8_9ACTN|nr:hypothetical protein [Streptomyces nitrosporeus]QEU72613.1 hypothetical protein CP967_11960 [Streptomyces nitrosporeus]GGY76503.1 hypothetical protein GCM10010327_03110 [Streptomyces nitrosporeus]
MTASAGMRRKGVVLLLRESEGIAALLQDSLETATDEERPGMERALALVREAAAVPDAALRGRWARQRLAAVGHEGPADSVQAIRALRRAEPGLSLLAAVTCAREAAETEGSAKTSSTG